jgi:arylsulfatase A-like enzyme
MTHQAPMAAARGVTRRDFLASVAAGAGAMALGATLPVRAAEAGARPNILWIVSEDNNPYLGCYGDKLARTPTLDGLAQRGILYENCFSQAPVCAPSRFTLISGMYATSCGPAEHMRARGNIPTALRGFPAYLRDAGYYCTNNAKTDYNAPISIKDAWDECGKTAHWRNRPAGKPFFAVFNHEVTHESSIFPKGGKPYERPPGGTDPAQVRLPAYHPDTPEFRTDRAHYYDQMALLDGQVAKLLKQLDDDGLAEDTIVFYYGDNGGILGRSKRFCFDSGLHVPLILRFPKKFQNLAPGEPGSRVDGPVSFVDFAPTVLSLAGAPRAKYMQGHAFAGPQAAGPQPYAFSFRNRMDDRYDCVRTVRDKRFRYIRNYMPHLIYGQHVAYMFQQRSVQQWFDMYQEGKLVGPQKFFWEEKPEEEFYDLQADPDEVKNLIAAPEHRKTIGEMRIALRQHLLAVRDNGFIPEGSPLEGYDASRDPKAYPLERILDECDAVTKRDPANLPKLIAWMDDENECIRYWAALGCVMLRGQAAPAAEALAKRLADAAGQVRVAAAEALCHAGQEAKGLPALIACLGDEKNPWVRLQAANALGSIGEKARPALAAIEKAVADGNNYVQRAAEYTVAVLKGETTSGAKPAKAAKAAKKSK